MAFFVSIRGFGLVFAVLLLVALGCTAPASPTSSPSPIPSSVPSPAPSPSPSATPAPASASPPPSSLPQSNQYDCLAPFTMERIQQYCDIGGNLQPVASPCYFRDENSERNDYFEISGRISDVEFPRSKTPEQNALEDVERVARDKGATYLVESGVGDQAWSISYTKQLSYGCGTEEGFYLLVRKDGFLYTLSLKDRPFTGASCDPSTHTPLNSCTIEQAKEIMREVVGACARGEETGYCAEVVAQP